MRASLADLVEEGYGNSSSDARKGSGSLITPKILRLLASAPEREVRLCVSTSPIAPYAQFEMLADDVDNGNRAFYARSERATAELLDRLSNDRNMDVRASVAGNPRTPTKALRSLGKYVCETIAEWRVDSDSLYKAGYKNPYIIIYDADEVGVRLASNPHTPSDILHKLSMLKSDRIKLAVASNSNAEPETMRELLNYAYRYEYRDRELFLDFCVGFAENPNTPPEMHRELARNQRLLTDIADCWYLPQGIVERIVEIAKECKDTRADSPQSAHSDNRLTSSDLEKMSFSKDTEVRRMVKDCNNTPLHVRQRLSYDPELVDWDSIDRTGGIDWSEVSMWDRDDWDLWSAERDFEEERFDTAQCSYSSGVNSQKEEILVRCLPKIDVPTSLLEILSLSVNPIDRMEAALDENTSVEILERLSLDHYSFVRSAVSSNKYADENTLRRLAKDEDASVRAQLVENENLPAEVLIELSEDTDQKVCYSAAHRADRLKYIKSTKLVGGYTVNIDTIEVMEELARFGDARYLELLASSKNTPSKTLEWIYSLRNMRLLVVLAHNPGMPDVSYSYVEPKSASTNDSSTMQTEHLNR